MGDYLRSKASNILGTFPLVCPVYKPAINKRIEYRKGQPGIPQLMEGEEYYESQAAFGRHPPYSIVSPFSPYALGWETHSRLLRENRGSFEGLEADIDYSRRTVTVRRKERGGII